MNRTGIGLHWWSPRRDLRTFQRVARHEYAAWLGLKEFGARSISNFGDELSPAAVAIATGRPVHWRSRRRAKAFAIGSIMEIQQRSNPGAAVWGTGIRNGSRVFMPPRGRFLAVRGELTRQALSLPPGIPLGDPGLLTRRIFAGGRKRSGTLLVPHFRAFATADNRTLMRSAAAKGMSIVPPTHRAADVCKAIADAELLITSSLHGLVVAHAVRTPAILVDFEGTHEPTFKYDDYMSAFGLTASVHPFNHVLDGHLDGARKDATALLDALSAPVDRLIDGLVEAARELP